MNAEQYILDHYVHEPDVLLRKGEYCLFCVHDAQIVKECKKVIGYRSGGIRTSNKILGSFRYVYNNKNVVAKTADILETTNCEFYFTNKRIMAVAEKNAFSFAITSILKIEEWTMRKFLRRIYGVRIFSGTKNSIVTFGEDSEMLGQMFEQIWIAFETALENGTDIKKLIEANK